VYTGDSSSAFISSTAATEKVSWFRRFGVGGRGVQDAGVESVGELGRAREMEGWNSGFEAWEFGGGGEEGEVLVGMEGDEVV